MGTPWGPPGANRTQVGPMLSPWNLLSEFVVFCGPLINVWSMLIEVFKAILFGNIIYGRYPKFVYVVMEFQLSSSEY